MIAPLASTGLYQLDKHILFAACGGLMLLLAVAVMFSKETD